MKNVELSEIMRAYSGWRCLFPVQSIDQFASFFSLSAACILALALLLTNLDPAAPQTPLAPLGYVLIPAAFGMTSPLFAVLPGRMTVRARAEANVGRMVEAALLRLGYVRADSTAGAIRYRNALPGWLHWKESEFSLAVSANAVTVSGPIYPLRLLRRCLCAQDRPAA